MSCPPSIVPDFGCDSGDGGGGGAGVESLNTLTGPLTIVPGNASINVVNSFGQIAISANLPDGGVQSVNGEGGVITLNGSGATTITNAGPAITIDTILPAIVNTINTTATGPVTITGTGASTVNTVGNVVTVNTTLPSIVNTINTTGVGAVTIAGDGNTTVSTVGSTITVSSGPFVNSINSQTGNLSIEGDVTGSATVQTFGSTISILVPNATVSNITGSGVATVTNAGSIFNVSVPAPPTATVTNITGTGLANVSSVAGVFNVDVPVIESGVLTLNDLIGNVNIVGGSGITVTNDPIANTITLDNTKSPDVVELNGLSGSLNIISSDGSLLVTAAGSDIDITVVGVPPVAGVTSVEGLTGVINLDSISGSIIFNADPLTGILEMDVVFPTPFTLNGINGAATVITTGVLTQVTAGQTLTLGVPDFPVSNITGSGSAVVTSGSGVFNIDVPTPDIPAVPRFKFFRTITVLSPTIVEGSWFTIASVIVDNDYIGATLFWSGNLEIRYDASFSLPAVPPDTNLRYGNYIIRVILSGDPTEYVPQVRKNCIYLPAPVTSPNLVRDVIPFTYYTFNFGDTALGPVPFDLQVNLQDMDPTTTTFTGVDLSVQIIKVIPS